MLCYLFAFLLFGLAAARPHVEEDTAPVAMYTVEPSIIGGSNVGSASTFPYQVSLQFTSGSHTCGASILSTTKLVCAAHCTQNSAGSYQIRAGSINRTSGGQVRAVTSRTNHPNYSGSASGIPNDISTLRVSALTFGSTVGSITMASSGTFAGASADLTGWGRTGTSNILPTTLQHVSMTTLSNTECASRMSGVSGASIFSSHVCFFRTGTYGACNGDSGGPARASGLLIGVTSWVVSSSGNCNTNYPSVYSRVSSFKSWVDSN